ncbi:hypothetical protein NN561_002790 [Cricetulus griseus]
MRSRGGGCTTSSLPAAARAPPVPEVRLHHPLAQAFPQAPSSRSPPPSTPRRPRAAVSGGGTMSQRVRRNGSPTPAGALAGGAVGPAGGPGSRLQPMRATVPPTRGTAPVARSSPPRPQPPPPLLGTVSSPSSSPTHLWPGEVSAAPPPARVRHRRRSPEQGRPSAEKRSPSAPVCKAAKLRKPQEIVQGQKYKLLDLWPKNMRAMHHQLTKRKEKLAAKKQQFRTWLNMLPKYSSQVLRLQNYDSNCREANIAVVIIEIKKDSLHSMATMQLLTRARFLILCTIEIMSNVSSTNDGPVVESTYWLLFQIPNTYKAPAPKSTLVPVVPITKSTGSRFRNSVEGLNQEIEIIIKETGEKEEQLVPQDIPDGHRAPPPLAQRSSSTRSIDTQTPGGADKSSNNSSRSQSVSPTSFLTISNEGSEESPCSADDLLADPRDKAECFLLPHRE